MHEWFSLNSSHKRVLSSSSVLGFLVEGWGSRLDYLLVFYCWSLLLSSLRMHRVILTGGTTVAQFEC